MKHVGLLLAALLLSPLAGLPAAPDERPTVGAIRWDGWYGNPANALIIYGWNEHDEGGWLQPTLGTDGKPDETRVNALGQVLRPSSPEKQP